MDCAVEPHRQSNQLKDARLKSAISTLQERLGYAFKNQALLTEALTHPSASTKPSDKTYQRLEFLGDRVLALAVSEMLISRFPSESEGHLARRLNELVRYETCADIAREWALGEALILGQGEERSGGRDKPAILGDACEAVIGAAYRDSGFDTARDLVRRSWSRLIEQGSSPPRDAKTALQEWAQARGLPAPTYRVTGRSGADHAPQFAIAAIVEGRGQAEGKGSSKRAAEHVAAENLLARLEAESAPPNG